MIKANYDWGTDMAAQLAALESRSEAAPQNDGDGKVIPDLEVEWAISDARLKEKRQLDARLAKIIEIIHEPSQLAERTIVAEFHANDQDR